MTLRAIAAAGVLGLALCAPARAETALQRVSWQLSRPAKGQAARFNDISALSLQAGKLAGRLRAKLTLLNRGPRPAEGVLLRYSVAARLAPKEGGHEGVWAVAFMIEERRVPMVGPNQIKEVPLDPAMLPAYLLRVAREGYRPEALKLQVMLEPRPGESGPLQMLENVLPVGPP